MRTKKDEDKEDIPEAWEFEGADEHDKSDLLFEMNICTKKNRAMVEMT